MKKVTVAQEAIAQTSSASTSMITPSEKQYNILLQYYMAANYMIESVLCACDVNVGDDLMIPSRYMFVQSIDQIIRTVRSFQQAMNVIEISLQDLLIDPEMELIPFENFPVYSQFGERLFNDPEALPNARSAIEAAQGQFILKNAIKWINIKDYNDPIAFGFRLSGAHSHNKKLNQEIIGELEEIASGLPISRLIFDSNIRTKSVDKEIEDVGYRYAFIYETDEIDNLDATITDIIEALLPYCDPLCIKQMRREAPAFLHELLDDHLATIESADSTTRDSTEPKNIALAKLILDSTENMPFVNNIMGDAAFVLGDNIRLQLWGHFINKHKLQSHNIKPLNLKNLYPDIGINRIMNLNPEEVLTEYQQVVAEGKDLNAELVNILIGRYYLARYPTLSQEYKMTVSTLLELFGKDIFQLANAGLPVEDVISRYLQHKQKATNNSAVTQSDSTPKVFAPNFFLPFVGQIQVPAQGTVQNQNPGSSSTSSAMPTYVVEGSPKGQAQP